MIVFDSFSRSHYITAKSHECDEVHDPDYTPSNSEKELFEAKQIFLFSVLDKHLITDMGKTIVRKYGHTTDCIICVEGISGAYEIFIQRSF